MGNVHMEATQVNYREGNKKMSVAEAIKNAGSEITPEEKAWIDTIPELASKEIIAPEFDAEAGTYAIGDLVMYEGKLYEFTSAHETPGDWDETEVIEKTVADEIDSLKSGLTNVHIYVPNDVENDYNAVFTAMGAVTGARYDMMHSGSTDAPIPAYGLCVTVKRITGGGVVLGSQFAYLVDGSIYKRVYANDAWGSWAAITT